MRKLVVLSVVAISFITLVQSFLSSHQKDLSGLHPRSLDLRKDSIKRVVLKVEGKRESSASEVRELVVSRGEDHNRELCQRQSQLIEDFQVGLSWRKLNSEEKKEYSLKVLRFSHKMAKELSRYSFKNNEDLLKGSDVDPKFVLQLNQLQKPCRNFPNALDHLIKTISENIDHHPNSSNWMVYRMAEVSMTFVKSLDSFEAYQLGIHMLDILGRKGHLKSEDAKKVRLLKGKLRKMAKAFHKEILLSTGQNQNVESILGHWEKQKMITKIEIKRYLTDISRRYPSQERRFGPMNLPEII